MAHSVLAKFDPMVFLAIAGIGKSVVHIDAKEAFFRQGDSADATYYIREGKAKLTACSGGGKEVAIIQLVPGDFVGEESLAAVHGLRMGTALAITPCVALRISRDEMIRVIHEEILFSEMFLAFMLARSMRTQAALIDRVFNSSEKRLAKILLLMSEMGKHTPTGILLPPVTQEALAEMVGTTRARVSFFMNRFRKLGFIEYDSRIRVHKSLFNLALYD